MLHRFVLSLIACGFLVSLGFPQGTVTMEYYRKGNTITCGMARFEFLSSTLVRMEYSPASQFVDVPTLLVVRRDWPEIKIEAGESNGWLEMKTGMLSLRYKLKSGRFGAENLVVQWKSGKDERQWKPGDKDDANLKAPGKTLDGVGRNRAAVLVDGILSRNGYFVLDDSRTPLWVKDSAWFAVRPEKENQDWYFFAYGHDYPHALKEFSELCGSIPMPPRYILGSWITDLNYQYLPGTEVVDKFHYTDEDVKNLVMRFRKENIPLDVLVLDYAWHNLGWQGGYDWSPIFPNPKEFLAWSHRNGLRVTVNDHPGYGRETTLSDEDSRAAAVRRELNMPVPPETHYAIDISKAWKFHTDPKNRGVDEQWFSQDFNDSSWASLNAGRPWERQGFPDYDGFGWYRKWVDIPAALKDTARVLVFGGVDDEYDLFINGQKVAHHGSTGSSVWNTPTWTEVAQYLKYGGRNLVAVRVNDWGGDGGLVRDLVTFADKPPAEHGIRFNLADKRQADVFMKDLHGPVLDDGVDYWWVDGWGTYDMEGITNQLWTNRLFYDFTREHTGKRGFIFSRNGGLGNHRYPSYFTGDTHSEWGVLNTQVPYTAIGGNILVDYITHDIGGFLGRKIPFDLYARWVEFGAFSPILRLHSAFENPKDGNLRMPWVYGQKGVDLVRDLFRLRYRLIPYIYTYSRIAHETAMPIVRPLYLVYPESEKAYSYPGEYFFGSEMLVAPVTDSTNQKEIYLPPGDWIDYFTGEAFKGDRVLKYECPVERIPVFVRSGSIIPMAPDMAFSDEEPLDRLIVDVYGPHRAEFKLYEDDGISLEYEKGRFAETPMKFSGVKGRGCELTVEKTAGSYDKQAEARSYEVRLLGVPKPSSVAVNGHNVRSLKEGAERWAWDPKTLVATIFLEKRSIREPLHINVR